MIKIFEIIHYTDGGLFDQGTTAAYIKGESEEEIRNSIANGNTGFVKVKEIPQNEYDKRKEDAYTKLNNLYTI